MNLHITHAGIENGDKAKIETYAANGRDTKTNQWLMPKGAAIGEEVVIYVGTLGFFATAIIKTQPKLRKNWDGEQPRYGVRLSSFQLIDPVIALAQIRNHVPNLSWAKNPMSIHTPKPQIAEDIRKLILFRPDLDEEFYAEVDLAELRRRALENAQTSVDAVERTVQARSRSNIIKAYVLKRANGVCEGCNQSAPFLKRNNTPYLEPHHTKMLAEDGPDDPRFMIALCPNCHREAHYSDGAEAFNEKLIKKLAKLNK